MTEGRRRDARAARAGSMDDELAPALWEEALRFALDLSQAAARCGRRACRKAGACRLRWAEGEPPACGGRAVSDDDVGTACAVALFASHLPPQLSAGRSSRGRSRD